MLRPFSTTWRRSTWQRFTTATVSNLTEGTTYHYRVTANYGSTPPAIWAGTRRCRPIHRARLYSCGRFAVTPGASFASDGGMRAMPATRHPTPRAPGASLGAFAEQSGVANPNALVAHEFSVAINTRTDGGMKNIRFVIDVRQ